MKNFNVKQFVEPFILYQKTGRTLFFILHSIFDVTDHIGLGVKVTDHL